MSSHDLKAFQLVAVQHELAMVIGLDLDLDRMLLPFMRACLRRLGLRGIHFFLADSSPGLASEEGPWKCEGATRRLSIPSLSGDPETERAVDRLGLEVTEGCQSGVQVERNGHHYLIFVLDQVGFMVLERTQRPIDPSIARSLDPIFARLAISCQACLEHSHTLEEIAARKTAEAIIVRQAAYDSLTDLPNRKTLNERLRQAVSAAMRHHHFGAIYFLDIDRFKGVNDSLGHAAGDTLLREIANRLAEVARAEDTVARVGGDEFVMVVTKLGDTPGKAIDSARALADRLVAVSSEPILAEGTRISVSASIGLAIFPNPALEGLGLDRRCQDLMRFADTAMYRAKDRGQGSFQFFEPEMQALSNRRLQVEAALRNELNRGLFDVHYQPAVTPDGQVVGAEALLRWESVAIGRVDPTEFIPVAEDSGLIVDIGRWTLREVCRVVARLPPEALGPSLRFSVNISARQIRQPTFVEEVLDAIRAADLSTRALVLELTESAAVADIEDTIQKMLALRKEGVHFALDDFGTGYSSLSYLHRLPVSTLKIDRSFVTDIQHRPDNQGIVDATIAMAERLGIACVVEGVESAEDLAYFSGLPIEAMQGYYFSKPLVESELVEALVRKRLGPLEPAPA